MKIFRAIFLELLWNSLLVSAVLVAVVALLRFARYLDSAAGGDIAVSVLLPVLLWRIPEFLGLLLPLGALLGVLFLLERMRADGELSILQNCGIGPGRLLLYCQWTALLLLGIVLFLGLYLEPLGRARLETLLHTPRIAEQVRTLAAGRFLQDGRAAFYVEEVQHTGQEAHLQGVFLADASGPGAPAVTIAARGALRDLEDAALSLHLEDGLTYRHLPEGTPDQPARSGVFELNHFDSLDYPLSAPGRGAGPAGLRAASSRALAASADPAARAMLHWRLGLPLLAPLAVLFAFALAAPGAMRRARTSWSLVAGALVYFLYVYALGTWRDLAAAGQLPLPLPLYLHLHLPAFVLTLLLLRYQLRRARTP